MKKTTKKLLSLATAALMAASSFITAFAEELPPVSMTIFGQSPVERSNASDDGEVWLRDYNVIIPDRTEISKSDLVVADGWALYAGDTIELGDYIADDGAIFATLHPIVNGEESELYARVWLWTLPAGTSVESLGEDAKYVIYANGNGTQATDTTAQPTDKGYGDWASDNKGWWIQYADGTYLTNGWWKSPASGLWYYMGADGYMVTNTVIDGYTINADGVWVQ